MLEFVQQTGRVREMMQADVGGVGKRLDAAREVVLRIEEKDIEARRTLEGAQVVNGLGKYGAIEGFLQGQGGRRGHIVGADEQAGLFINQAEGRQRLSAGAGAGERLKDVRQGCGRGIRHGDEHAGKFRVIDPPCCLFQIPCAQYFYNQLLAEACNFG